ncbi:MAG: hypothetical protein PVI20_09135 [Desulfobacteraceae bacterium]
MSNTPASRKENFKEVQKRKRVALHTLEEALGFLFLTACLFNTDLLFLVFFVMSDIRSQLSVVKP